MALSELEKDQLREFLVDTFVKRSVGPNVPFARNDKGPLTAAILKEYSEKSDEEIRKILEVYNAGKKDVLLKKKTELEQELLKIEDQIKS